MVMVTSCWVPSTVVRGERVGQRAADIERFHRGVAVVERVGPHPVRVERVAAVAIGGGGAGRYRLPAVGLIVDVGRVEIAGRGRNARRAVGDPAGLHSRCPSLVPLITAASLAPWMVMVTTCEVPSTVKAVNVSVNVCPALSACTAGLLSSSV